jgi:serine/threonine protein kinase
MPDVTSDRLLELLQLSNLLTTEQLDSVRTDFAIAEQLPQLIEQLAERGWLTHWQGKMLLSGRHAFFLGKYKLLDHLGEGGMGSVLKAEQTPLGRLVAIKTLRKDLVGSKDLVARFHREIQAAAALNHPNIVAAYDADSIAGRHFLVMEYVEGRDLGVVVKRGGKLPIGAACEYVCQAALGLQHAHEHGIVHRDIKPSNLMLDSRGRVKILDMGLARIVQDSGNEQTELTHTGQVMGTPDYIAPEQALDSKAVDIRSDIYSLGCTLYRLLTGKVPFQGDGAIAKITARLTNDPPLLRSRLPEAPAELEAVLLTMMARDVADRYQIPTEVVRALTPFADAAAEAPTSHETSAAATAAIEPTIIAPVASELNDFLNQLAVAAERDEEVDTGTQELEKTEVGEQSVDQSALTQKYEPEAPSTDTSPAPRISRAGRKLQDEIAARKQADKRRLIVILSVVVLFVAVVIGLVAWNKTGETHLVVDSGAIKLKSATLEVDGRQRQLVKAGNYEYRGRPGIYRLTLTRDGYETIEAKWTLTHEERRNHGCNRSNRVGPADRFARHAACHHEGIHGDVPCSPQEEQDEHHHAEVDEASETGPFGLCHEVRFLVVAPPSGRLPIVTRPWYPTVGSRNSIESSSGTHGRVEVFEIAID